MTSFGWTCADHWNTSPHSRQEHPCLYNFSPLMRRKCFEETQELQFTSFDCPEFCDRFWEVHEMIDAWNKNMELYYESMSIWFQHWTCPGWVICPHKPYPFGNEYHTACCGLTGILFSLEMVEGKDRPNKLAAPDWVRLLAYWYKCFNLYSTVAAMLF